MSEFGLTYRMNWQTAELHDMELNIWDRLNTQGGPRPYNITWISGLPGNGWNVEFTFDELPPDSTGLVIQASIPGTNISYSFLGGTVSPRTISLPYSDGVGWVYKFLIQNPGQGEIIDLSILYPLIIPIKGAGRDPVQLSVVDNDDDLFKTVKAKQLLIEALTASNFNLASFDKPESYDNRYYVTLHKAGRPLFYGYLILDELNEPFLGGRNQISLRATDRLGTLKDFDLLKPDGTNPRGASRIIDYIAWALKGTGLSLKINVCMNLREAGSAPVTTFLVFDAPARVIAPLLPQFTTGRAITFSGTASNNFTAEITHISGPIVGGPHDGKYWVYFDSDIVTTVPEEVHCRIDDAQPHMYHRCWLDARTWEKDINTSQDAYTVINRILFQGMFITQEKGEWWIKRHNETGLNQLWITVFDADGNYIQANGGTNYGKAIARGLSIQHINRGTSVYLNRPYKHVKLNYAFNYPKELVCNVDYKRGEVIEEHAPDPTQAASTGRYKLECWDLSVNDVLQDPKDDWSYIQRDFVYGKETARYMVLGIYGSLVEYKLESSRMPVRAKDRININVDYRYNAEAQTGGGFYRNFVAQIRLYADSGNRYTLHGGNSNEPNAHWDLSNNDWTTNNRYIYYEGNVDQDKDTEWRTAGLWQGDMTPDIPEDGYLTIVLVNQIRTDDREKHFSNIRLDYIPYLNGTYKLLNGKFYQVSQPASDNGTYVPVWEEDVYIGDAWTRNFKGALLIRTREPNDNSDNWVYKPAGDFYDATYNQDVPAPEDFRPYLEFLAFDVYNQLRYVTRTWRASLKGLELLADAFDRDDTAGLLHRYRMNDPSVHGTSNKTYHLISFNQGYGMDQWTGVFREVYDFLNPRTLDRQLLTVDYKEDEV